MNLGYRVLIKLVRLYREKKFRRLTKNEKGTELVVYGPVYMFNCNISYKNNLKIFPNVCFMGSGKIEIGENVAIGNDTIIYASKEGGVVIGNNVSIAAHTYIIDSNHGIEYGRLINEQGLASEKITIGDDVWIADNCTILKGVNIGDGAVIGAKSLVNKDVETNAVAFGVPAKAHGYRQPKFHF